MVPGKTNLTKLGRIGVSCTKPCKVICVYCSLSFAFLWRNCKDRPFLMGAKRGGEGGQGRGYILSQIDSVIKFFFLPL